MKEFKTRLSIYGRVDKSLKSALRAAESATAKTAKKISSGIGKAAKLAAGLTAAAVTATAVAVGAMGVQSVQNAVALESQMNNVATLLDGTAEQVKARTAELSEEVIKVSNDTGIATEGLTAGLYDVISAVGDSKDATEILAIAAKAAAAGNAETAESVALLTAVTKGYGDTSLDAFSKASDLAFQTVKLGQTTFPELASSIGKVTPLAAALGVQQEELFGIFATLTGVTGTAAEVSTQYKAVLSGLMSPSKGMAESLDKLGYATGAAAIEALGFQGTLQALMGTVDGDTQSMAKLFSSVEAQTAILSLCGEQATNLASKTEAMYNASGAAQTAFDAQTQGLEYTVQRLKNTWDNFLTQTGQQILPIISDLAEKALPLLSEAIEKISPLVEKLITYAGPKISELAERILPNVRKAFELISPAITRVNELIQKMQPIISTTLSVLEPMIRPIVQIFETCIEIAGRLFEILAPIATQIEVGLGIAIQSVLLAIANLKPQLHEIISQFEKWRPLLQLLASVITIAANAIAGFVSGALTMAANILPHIVGYIGDVIQIAKELADFVVNVLQGNWSAALENMKNIAGSAIDMVKQKFQGLADFLRGIAQTISNIASGIFRTADKAKNANAGVGGAGGSHSIKGYANGGTVTRAEYALIGEGRYPETIIPHTNNSRSRALLATATAGVYGSNGSPGGNKTYNITFAPVINSNGDVSEQIDNAFERFKEFWAQKQEEDDREVFA